MSSERRLVLFFILSFFVLMVFGRLNTKPYVPVPSQTIIGQESSSKAYSKDFETAEAKQGRELDTQWPFENTRLAESEETLEFEDEYTRMQFSNRGATLVGYNLLKYLTKSGETVNLIPSYEQVLQESGDNSVNILSLEGPFGTDADLLYVIKEKTDHRLVFEAVYKGWYLEKEYELGIAHYMLGLTWKIEPPKNNWDGNTPNVRFVWGPNLGDGMDTESSMASRAGFRGIWLPEWGSGTDDYMLTNKKDKERSMGPARWLGLKSRYFMLSWIPNEGYISGRTIERVRKNQEDETPRVRLEIPLSGPTGSTKIYLGPLEYPLLTTETYKSLNLSSGVDLGWSFFRPFSVGMLRLLNIFFDYTKNYGTAIILLTLLVKIVLWYPSHKSQLSMKKMQVKMKVVQPKLDALKKRFKGNSQKISEETMKLYKEQGINPASGCLPMLIQLPIMFALYSTLANAIELRGAPALWLDDLSTADPTHVLPVIMGAGMLAQTLLAGSMAVGAPAQQRMMMIFMPIMFTAISFSLPSGLILYWAFLNIISIVQTQIVNKRVKALGLT